MGHSPSERREKQSPSPIN